MDADAVQQAQQASQQLADQVQPAAPAQKASAVSTWLNRGFVVVILVAIPLLYYFGYIGGIWLNRIGIILNFCAGFMVAPELLGIKRLQKVEIYIEKVINKIHGVFRPITSFLFSNKTLFALVLQALLSGHFFVVIVVLVGGLTHIRDIVLSALCVLLVIILSFTLNARSTSTNKSISLLEMIVYCLFTAIILLLSPIIAIISILILLSHIIIVLPIEYTIRKLSGDNRLRSIFVWWGIIFFIVGNLLQFISTF